MRLDNAKASDATSNMVIQLLGPRVFRSRHLLQIAPSRVPVNFGGMGRSNARLETSGLSQSLTLEF